MTSLFPIPPEFVRYLAEYHGTRDYFECHEIMEEYWKEHPGDRHSGCWLVLIRIAVMQYHARRGNGQGAYKLLKKACEELEPEAMLELGLDGAGMRTMLEHRLLAWQGPSGVFYDDFNLPISRTELLESAIQFTEEMGAVWLSQGEAAPENIIHRHARRDRSDVIEAREASVKRKALNRPRAEE